MNKVFTETEVVEIKNKIVKMKTVAGDDATWLWNLYKRVTGSNERQPCTCGSSAKHWQKAYTTVNNHLKEYDE